MSESVFQVRSRAQRSSVLNLVFMSDYDYAADRTVPADEFATG